MARIESIPFMNTLASPEQGTLAKQICNCRPNGFPDEKVEEKAWDAVEQLLASAEIAKRIIEKAQRVHGQQMQRLTDEKILLKQKIVDCKKQSLERDQPCELEDFQSYLKMLSRESLHATTPELKKNCLIFDL